MALGAIMVAALPFLLVKTAPRKTVSYRHDKLVAATPAKDKVSSSAHTDEEMTRVKEFRQKITGNPTAATLPQAPHFDCKPVRKDKSADENQYPVPLPPFSKDIFPCTRCHDKPEDYNTTKRTLTLEHLNIHLNHGPREQWCYGCHNPTFRDKLRLAGGRLVSFKKSYELCGQCHGPKLRDWRKGIHGRRVGCWNGKRQYLLCVHCHSPHSPKFPKIKPMPRPKKPSEI